MHHILVVDDEPTICAFVQEFLEDEGYRSACASNGVEALQQIRQIRPDLVLMDIMMPGLDGRAVVRHLQAHPTYAGIPVILMSAAVRWDEAIDGPIQFISKPFDLDRLLRMINQVFGTYSAGAGEGPGPSGQKPQVARTPSPNHPHTCAPGISSAIGWVSMPGLAGSS